MNLEDEFSDVIAKALAGLEMEEADLAVEAGVEVCEISGLLHGDMDEEIVRKICPVLELDSEVLIALPDYAPQALVVPGIERVVLPFRQWTVNAWVISKGETRLLFDAGYGEHDVSERIVSGELTTVFITHDHPDHIGGLASLKSRGVPVISVQTARKEKCFVYGDLSIRVVDLAGHMDPAVGYFIDGLEKQLLVVGDAIFAGSMGRCKSRASYDLAFETLNDAFSQADKDCIILPGHGPATTLAEELCSNPFRPRFS